VSFDNDAASYETRLRAKLTPAAIRSTMAFAALYQMTGEMIRHAVLDEVKQFFATGFADGQWITDTEQYQTNALVRDKSAFTASPLWLVDINALTIEQAENLSGINAHRNDLTLELIKYLVDPDANPDVELFSEAVTILRSLRRFWTGVEADIGTFDEFDDLDLDEVMPLSVVVLQQCLDAYIDGLAVVDETAPPPTT
jgi:hypothetical protein